ncbi:DUF6042 family protein [Thermoflavimicrobium dichotomicum]|uniref:DUF6042 family protein n=1 Tax=Thermoflavimicrobium dichotomicum TaxID=46223 RepID=UPI001113DE99|nr:DUF6042 family protein [Thermoflavimicrobium dichotomicum]
MLSQSWDEGKVTLPPDFLQNGWNLFLPKGTISILLSVMTYILQGYTKEEILEWMKMEEKELSLSPFDFTLPFVCKSEEEKQAYLNIARQERKICKILERSGYAYPKTIDEWIELLIQLKIVQEVKMDEAIYLDVVLEPFPHPEDMLKLTPDERKKLEKYRLNQHMQQLSEL